VDGFPGQHSSAKPSMSLPSKACNILRGRISFIAVNAREENHHRAIRALAYKWIRIIFACWKANKPH
jgi:hypothetical protein